MSNKLKPCKSCNQEVDKSAKSCPHCGQRLKNRRVLKLILSVISIPIVLLVIGNIASSPNKDLSGPNPELSDYHSKATPLDYRKGMLSEYEQGTLFEITGRVTQVIDSSSILVATKKSSFNNYIDDLLLVSLQQKPDFIEDDILHIQARYLGTQRYRTVLRKINEVPAMQADYIKVIQKRD
jgi:hypothetical protein